MPKLYHSVPLDEEQNHEVREKRVYASRFDRDAVTKTASNWAWLAHAILLSISMTLFTLSFCRNGASSHSSSAEPSDYELLMKTSTYSPLFPAVKYGLRRYGLSPVTNSSFAGYGPEVDKNWDYIANEIGDIMITENERKQLGLSPDSLPIQNPRTGEWGYRAGVEVFHQLHCLNLLRQAVHIDYYSQFKPEEGGDIGDAATKEDLLGHVDHCIEAIRENLMCQSDVTVFTFKKFPELEDQGIEGEWPDFQINHMCRDFEAVRKWNNDHVAAWDHNA